MIRSTAQAVPRREDEPIELILDANNRILACGEAWDRFARENDAPELATRDLLGRSLEDFVSGKVTRAFLADLLVRVRKRGHTLVIPYRCDSPRVRRFMRMEIQPLAQGRVRWRHWILRTEPLPWAVTLEIAPQRRRDTYIRCSLCGRMRWQDSWIEPLSLVLAAGLPPARALPVTYGLCPACRRWAEEF